MKIGLVYICAPIYQNNGWFSRRFAMSYAQFGPGYPHRSIVVENGLQIADNTKNTLKSSIPECVFVRGDNVGWDIGAYRSIASQNKKWGFDALFCCGTSTHFKRSGWLKRMADVWNKRGPGFYGSMGSFVIRPHIRTAGGFLISPELLVTYPHQTKSKKERYNFEHGKQNIEWWATRNGKPAMVVAWDGEYDKRRYGAIPRGHQNKDQSNCLNCDRVSDMYSR